jgi:flavin-binding protein dodecin
MKPRAEDAQAPSAVKVEEMLGVSSASWEDAARLLVQRASRTTRHITGFDLIRSAAAVRNGRIAE